MAHAYKRSEGSVLSWPRLHAGSDVGDDGQLAAISQEARHYMLACRFQRQKTVSVFSAVW